MQKNNTISIQEFLKLLNFYKNEITMKYQEKVDVNDQLNSVEDAVIEQKIKDVKEQLEEADMKLDKEEPIVLEEVPKEDPFQLRLDINEAHGKSVSIYKSNDVVPTDEGMLSKTYFAMEGDDALLQRLDTDPQIKTSIDHLLSKESIDLFFENSFFDIPVEDASNQCQYILRCNLNEQFLLQSSASSNDDIKKVKIGDLPHSYLDILTINKQDLPVVLKQVYPKFQQINSSFIKKAKYKIKTLKKKI